MKNICAEVMAVKVCMCQMSGTDGKPLKNDRCHCTIQILLYLQKNLINFHELLKYVSPFQLCTLGDHPLLATPKPGHDHIFYKYECCME
jgi:hypothetical protein